MNIQVRYPRVEARRSCYRKWLWTRWMIVVGVLLPIGFAHEAEDRAAWNVRLWGSHASAISVPVLVDQLSGVVAIAAGGGHNLVRKSDGTVWAWGYNGSGQLGTGTVGAGSRPVKIVPVQVKNLTDVVAVEAGPGHSLALKRDGTVWAWGHNNYGQLGSPTPLPLSFSAYRLKAGVLGGIVAIAAGDAFSLALKNDGTIRAFGRNYEGQLGNGSNNPNSAAPVKVSGLTQVIAVAAGDRFGLALRIDGTVWAWGTTPDGQVSTVPVQVKGLSGVAAIATGADFALALKGDRTVWAWGSNAYGQLGNGSTTSSNVPVRVSNLADVIAIRAGAYHSMALRRDGTVRTWGWNGEVYGGLGQLGNGSHTDSTVPVSVIGLTGVTAIAGGGSHSLALTGDGKIWAWGDNHVGQLAKLTVRDLAETVAVAGSTTHSLALKADGTVRAWGSNWRGQLGNGSTTESQEPVKVSNLTDVVAVGVGGYHSLALRKDGTVRAWGNNEGGELGNGDNNNSSVPVAVKNLTGVAAVAAGVFHSLALKSDGTVWAWGGNLGNGTSALSNVPVQVQDSSGGGYLTGVVAISAGGEKSLAMKSDGTVWEWGPYLDSNRPVQVHGIRDPVAISRGFALASDGTVWQWGYWKRATKVPNLSHIKAIAAGGGHALFLTKSASVQGWGYNWDGQVSFGVDSRKEHVDVPITVRYVPTPIAAIAAGDSYSLAVVANGIPGVTLDRRTVNFRGEVLGKASPSEAITITNTGETPLRIHAVALTGMNPGDFSKTADTCAGALLAPAAVCDITVQFAPKAAGARSAAFLVTSNGPLSPHVVLLRGAGTR